MTSHVTFSFSFAHEIGELQWIRDDMKPTLSYMLVAGRCYFCRETVPWAQKEMETAACEFLEL